MKIYWNKVAKRTREMQKGKRQKNGKIYCNETKIYENNWANYNRGNKAIWKRTDETNIETKVITCGPILHPYFVYMQDETRMKKELITAHNSQIFPCSLCVRVRARKLKCYPHRGLSDNNDTVTLVMVVVTIIVNIVWFGCDDLFINIHQITQRLR